MHTASTRAHTEDELPGQLLLVLEQLVPAILEHAHGLSDMKGLNIVPALDQNIENKAAEWTITRCTVEHPGYDSRRDAEPCADIVVDHGHAEVDEPEAGELGAELVGQHWSRDDWMQVNICADA